jgi:hypothetical protein
MNLFLVEIRFRGAAVAQWLSGENEKINEIKRTRVRSPRTPGNLFLKKEIRFQVFIFTKGVCTTNFRQEITD